MRRFEELLVELCEQSIIPPRTFTIGSFLDSLIPASFEVASELETLLAAQGALQNLSAEALRSVFPVLPEKNNSRAWLELGKVFLKLRRELRGECLDFPSLVKFKQASIDGNSSARWETLAAIDVAYQAELQSIQRHDREELLIKPKDSQLLLLPQGPLFLVALSDFNRLAAEIIECLGQDRDVTALVYAPEDLSAAFDPLGRVVQKFWCATQIDLSKTTFEVCANPGEQAQLVLNAIERYAEQAQAGTADITIGVADESFAPYLKQTMADAEIPTHFALGQSLKQSAPVRILSALNSFLKNLAFEDFAVLLRIAEVENFIKLKLGISDRQSLPTLLDNFHSQHLPGTLEDLRSLRSPEAKILQEIAAALNQLTEHLRTAVHSLPKWPQIIFEVLAQIFGETEINKNSEISGNLFQSLEILRDAGLIAANLQSHSTPISGTEALDLFLLLLESQQIATEPENAALDVVGWLELTLDDAPLAIVSGLNEGIVPGVLSADPFLPNQLRKQLGLVDNDRRLARDSYALTVLTQTREALTLFCIRRTPAGDALLPSRLFYRCPDSELAKRVLLLMKPLESVPAAGADQTTKSTWNLPPLPAGGSPIKRLSIGSFKTYLECPYTFYLKHVLHLEELSDDALEMDGALFGSLIHDVLSKAAERESLSSVDAEEIWKALSAVLDEECAQRFGAAALPAVYIQIEQIRSRFRSFAEWQANRSQAGWQIKHSEFKLPDDRVQLTLSDGTKISLSGRIDRIDYHPGKKQFAVIDYKTGENSGNFKKIVAKSDQWSDLQLPLYVYACQALGFEGEIEPAYLTLSKSEVDYFPANWTAEDLNSAWEQAREVAANILNQKFWPPASKRLSPDFDVLFPSAAAAPIENSTENFTANSTGER